MHAIRITFKDISCCIKHMWNNIVKGESYIRTQMFAFCSRLTGYEAARNSKNVYGTNCTFSLAALVAQTVTVSSMTCLQFHSAFMQPIKYDSVLDVVATFWNAMEKCQIDYCIQSYNVG